MKRKLDEQTEITGVDIDINTSNRIIKNELIEVPPKNVFEKFLLLPLNELNH